MPTTTVQSLPSPTLQNRGAALAEDFELLGLKQSEARVERIRKAARALAEEIHLSAVGDAEQHELVMRIALSTYRLLDPRQRSNELERIQLAVFSEDDLELQRSARRSWDLSETECCRPMQSAS